MYLAAVIDRYSRYVIAWRLSNTLDGSFCLELLEEALAQGRPVEPPAATPPQLRLRLELAAAVLRLLEQDRLASRPTPSPAPARIGRFRILGELGHGGFGLVYLAEDPRLGRTVALKVPRPDTVLTPELSRRFLREAHTAAGFDHPHLVPVHEAGADGAVCYIVSAYCPGGSLADWLGLQKAAMPWELAARVVAARNPAEAVPRPASRATRAAGRLSPRRASRSCSRSRARASRPLTEAGVQPSCRAASSCVQPSRQHRISGRR